MDANGKPFVMRGINHAHSWYKGDLQAAIPAIAKTGANVVRVVLSNGDLYQRDEADAVQSIMELCERNKLILILEVHDATGSDDDWRLDNAVNYWIGLKPVIEGHEDKVIINIANEWHGTSESSGWARGYQRAVKRLRTAGLQHLLIVDTAGWGQHAPAIKEQGASVLAADPLWRTIFSIHMYEVAAPDAATVSANIDNSLAVGVPVIVGEFSDAQNGKPVDYRSIMKYCKEKNVGWLAWSWYGNNADTANMDMAKTPAGPLTKLGKEIVDGHLGIRATAKPATVW